ncbi:MAG TPA: DMT family transporter [Prolixibacteraceae bacterium]|nr:DMT family transporter [Prolixibacteraceae bacterium]
MIFLWLSILCSSTIYVLFKTYKNLNAGLTGIIIINYFVAFILGLVSKPTPNTLSTIIHSNWIPMAMLIGFLFVAMFFLIGISTQKNGIGITTIATRMSMVIPIFFSMFIFNEEISLSKLLKIGLTIIAVVLAIYSPKTKNRKNGLLILPFVLFIGSGGADTLVKTAQQLFVPEHQLSLFSSLLFGTSFIASFFLLFQKPKNEKLVSVNNLFVGSMLGAVNFGSLFFIMKALNNSGMASSLVFGINNLAIVGISLIIGFFAFKEKLKPVNWVGIVLSAICIVLLTANRWT